MGIQKYRVAWRFSGTKNTHGQFYSWSSPTFRLNHYGGYYYIDLNIQILPSGNCVCRVSIRSTLYSICHKVIRQCSYYLLNETTGQNHKLVNLSPFKTDWIDLGSIIDRLEFMVVFAMDIFEPTANFEHWLEAVTLNPEPNDTKRNLSYNFKNMDIARKTDIAKILEKIDLQPSKVDGNSELNATYIIQQKQPKTKLQLPDNNPTTPIKHRIIECTNLAPVPATAVSALPEILKFMYQYFTEKKFCDITIKVHDGHEIRAHKTMLCAASTVWRQILTDDERLSVIATADMERETIETLLTYIYIGSVPNPPKQTDQLLIAAETYGVDGLKIWCEQQLISTITIDSAIHLLVLAHRYKATALIDEAWKFIKKHAAELKQRDEWKTAFCSYPELTFELFNSLL